MQPSDTPGAAGTCSDCPPVGYPTDATRCLPCPRRGAPQNVLTPGATEIEAAVAWAKERVTWPTPWEAFVRNARALLHLHAQVATLTARAEKAEAFIDRCIKQGAGDDGTQARRYLARAEAAEARLTLDTPPGLHPDTVNLVHLFAEALARKLHKAELKYGYSNGWADPNWEVECRAKLLEHVDKGDPRDVAAYCAFMWRHGWKTGPNPLAARVATLEAANGKLREMLGRAGGLLGQFYEHHGWTPVGREVIAIIGKATTPRDGGGNG